jgi:methyl-accepting chemotaxis protein
MTAEPDPNAGKSGRRPASGRTLAVMSELSSTPRGWGGRLGVGRKLRLALGGLLALVLAVLLLAVALVAHLGHDENQLNQGDVAFASATATAALQAKGVANDERGYLISGDGRYVAEATQRIAAARTAFEEASQSAGSTAQQEVVRRARAGFDQWVAAVQTEFTTYPTDHQAAIDASLGSTRDLRKTYEHDLGTAQELGQSSISAAASNVSLTASWSMRILIACLAVVLLAGVLVSTWVVRYIAQPLHSLADLLVG